MRASRWRRYLRFWRRDPAADVDDELRFHFAERVSQFEADGMSREQATRAARERFGDLRAVRSSLVAIDRRIGRRNDAWRWLDALRQDARHVLRSLARQPALVATVVATLALAVGANAAVFSLVDALVLKPPAGVEAPRSLRWVASTHPHATADLERRYPYFGYLDYRAIRDGLRDVADVAIATHFDSTEVVVGTSEEIAGVSYSTAGLLPMLGVRIERGRTFDARDDDVHAPAFVAVVSHAFANSAFGSVDDALGQELRVRDRTYRIIGVLAGGFDGIALGATAVWMPFSTMPHFDAGDPRPWYDRDDSFFPILLRMRPGRSAPAVEARATAVYRHTLDASAPYWRESRILLSPLSGAGDANDPGKESLVATRFAGVTLLLLLIACANVANLLLARGISRRRALGGRSALGISRRRLAALVFLEALALALVSGCASILVANWAGSALRARLMPRISWAHAPVDARVFAFTVALTFAAALLAGAAPAITIARFGVDDALKSGAHDGGAHRGRVRAALLMLQAALCVTVLVGTAWFGRSLRNVLAIDMGYDAQRIVVGTVYARDRVRHPEMKILIPEVARRMRELPGVAGAVATYGGPQSSISGTRLFRVGDDSSHDVTASLGAMFTGVGSDYFRVMGTRIIDGRGFLASDTRHASPVIVVSQRMAHALWPGQRALGKCLKPFSPAHACYTVVGVAENAREMQRVSRRPEMQYYYPLDQLPDTNWSPNAVFVRVATARPTDVARTLGAELRRAAPNADVRAVPIEQSLEPELRPWKLGAQLFATLSVLALVIAIIGIYGVVAFDVRQRTREIGVRLALGAQRLNVVGLLVRRGARVVGFGIVLGVAASLYAGRFVESLLYGVAATDPVSIIAAAAMLFVVAIVASAVPAWRANRVDPAVVLRDE